MDEICQAILYLQCFPKTDHVVFDQIKLCVVCLGKLQRVHDSVETTRDERVLGLPKLASSVFTGQE